MKYMSALIIVTLLTVSSAFAMKSVTYKVDPSASKMEWVGEKVSGEHFGTIKIKNGSLSVLDNKIEQGTFNVDMTTITVDDIDGEWGDKLLAHLKSDDFFSVQKHNDSKFEIINVKDLGNNKAKVSGRLTIKEISKVITFDTDYTINGNSLTANAEIVIDRTKFNIEYGSGNFFENLGDKMIYDDFTIKLKLVASK